MGLRLDPVSGMRRDDGRRTGAATAMVAAVDIIWFPLDRPSAGDVQLLSSDELARAGRFRFSRDRSRYIAGRAQLRRILSDRCGAAASTLEFVVGSQGKPALIGHPEVDFNLSHAGATAVAAITDGCSVGIDVEADNPGIVESGIAEQFFAPGEVDHLQSVPTELRDHAFLECWTRKEAYLKGKGGGLSLPLDEFEVSFGPDRPAALIRADGDPSDCETWSLVDLTADAPGGFVAALAVHAPEGGYRVDVIGERQRSST